MKSQRWAVLGASRGFGAGLAKKLKTQGAQVCKVARGFQRDSPNEWSWDLSRSQDWPRLAARVEEFNPTHLVYVAGGGPFGAYGKKEWKDHDWAWRVSFQAPAFLLHWFLKESNDLALKYFFCVGSAVAEERPDPLAASYAAAKHALKGLLTSVSQEPDLRLQVGLWSPTYMDTDLLPPNAKPRHDGSKILTVDEATKAFLDWAQTDEGVSCEPKS